MLCLAVPSVTGGTTETVNLLFLAIPPRFPTLFKKSVGEMLWASKTTWSANASLSMCASKIVKAENKFYGFTKAT